MRNRTLLILFLAAVLCFTGCANNTNNSNSDLDIWCGVSGDTQELLVTGREMTVVLNKDGAANLSSQTNEFVPASEFGDQFKDFDAEMGGFKRLYGTYKTEGGNLVLLLENLNFTCLAVRGKDADAFKEAYIAYRKTETPAEADAIEAAFGKGYAMSKSDGTQTLQFHYSNKELQILTIQNHNTEGILVSESVMNEDGSYTNTFYYEDGKIREVREYNSDDRCTKKTAYLTDGSVEYVETNVADGNGNATIIRKDAAGNVLLLEEHIKVEYESGNRTIQRRTEKGVVVYSNVCEERSNGLTVRVIDEIQGDVVCHTFEVHNEISGIEEFYQYKQTEADKLTAYQCSRYYGEESDLRYRSVTYNMDTEVFSLIARYADGGENHNEIPASDYIHGEWENHSDYE